MLLEVVTEEQEAVIEVEVETAVIEEAVTVLAVWEVTPFLDEKRPVSDPTVGQLCWVYGSVYCMHTLPKPDRVLYRLVGVTREALLLTSAF